MATDQDNQRQKSGREQIPASEALARLRSGETLRGLRIDRLEITGEWENPLSFDHCELSRLRIHGATFRDSFALRHCHLKRPRIHRGTEFCDEVQWAGTRVHALVMERVVFRRVWRLNRAVFESHCRLNHSRFLSGIRGFAVTFEDWAEWNRCQFNRLVDLRSAHFQQGFIWQGCEIVGDLNLRGCTIDKKLDLGATRLHGTLDLSKAKLHDFVYLQDTKLTDQSRFAFANALADYIHIEPEQVEYRLLSETEGRHSVACQEYGLLKRSFSTLHQYEEEDWAFYRFKVNQRQTREWNWMRPGSAIGRVFNYLFLDIGCGYGVQPWRALAFGGVTILFFAALYAAGTAHFTQYHPPFDIDSPKSLVNRSLFGLLTSVSVFTAGFTGDQLNNASGWVLLPLAVEAVLGTVLWGLFIVAFSRKVIR